MKVLKLIFNFHFILWKRKKTIKFFKIDCLPCRENLKCILHGEIIDNLIPGFCFLIVMFEDEKQVSFNLPEHCSIFNAGIFFCKNFKKNTRLKEFQKLHTKPSFLFNISCKSILKYSLKASKISSKKTLFFFFDRFELKEIH